MQHFLNFILCTFCVTCLYGQPNVVDSIIANAPKANAGELNELLRMQGILYKNKGDYENADLLYEAALQGFRSQKDSIGIGNVYNNLAYLAYRKNEIDKSLEYYYEAIKVFESIGEADGLAKVYINLAGQYYHLNNYKESLRYYYLSAEKLEDLKDEKRIAGVHLGIGSLLSNNKFEGYDLQESVKSYQKALDIYDRYNDSINISKAFNNLGGVYELQEKYDDALNSYKNSLVIKLLLNEKHGELISYLNIGNVLQKLGKLNESLDYYKKGEALAKELEDDQIYLHILHGIVSITMKLGRMEESVDLFKQYSDLQEGIFNEETGRQINELQAFYEFEKKERNLLYEKNENRIKTMQNNWLIGLTIGLLLMIAVSVILFYLRLRMLRKLRIRELAQAEKEKEIVELNSIMIGQEKERKRLAKDLHDRLGAQLAAIRLIHSQYDKIANEKWVDMDRMLDGAIVETREISHNLVSSSLTRYGLVAALQQQFDRLNESGQITAQLIATHIKGRLPADLESTLYYVVQELVANTLKHAKAQKILLQIINHSDNTLSVIYEDNGLGFEVNHVEQGMGLKNIHARLSLINGQVNIESSSSEGVTIIIEIPSVESLLQA